MEPNDANFGGGNLNFGTHRTPESPVGEDPFSSYWSSPAVKYQGVPGLIQWAGEYLPCSFHTWRMSQCFEDILPMKSQSHSPWLPWLVKRAEGWTFSFISLISSSAPEGEIKGLSPLWCPWNPHGGSWSNSFYPQARQGVTFPVHALSATPSRIWSAADCRGWYHCSRPAEAGIIHRI